MNKLYTVTEIGKPYGLTARQVNAILKHSGVIRKNEKSGYWELCTAHLKKGLVVVLITPFMHSDGTPDESRTMKWTGIGKMFVEDLIESKGFSVVKPTEGVKS